jgi:hypothetical protein
MSVDDDDLDRLTYRDLLELKLVRNRATLRNRVLYHGFPPGRLTGPNSRTWGRGEIRDYIAGCPTEPRASVMPPRRRRHRDDENSKLIPDNNTS